MPVPLAATVFNQQSRPFPPRAGGGTICAKFRGAWRPRRSPQHSSTKNCSFPARTGAPDRKQALSKIPAAEKTSGQNPRPTNAENIMTQRTQQSHITQTARERTAKARIRDAPHTVHATKPSFARKIPFSTYKLQTCASASILPSALRNNRAYTASETFPPASPHSGTKAPAKSNPAAASRLPSRQQYGTRFIQGQHFTFPPRNPVRKIPFFNRSFLKIHFPNPCWQCIMEINVKAASPNPRRRGALAGSRKNGGRLCVEAAY